jgi:hypothetical protein
MIFFHKTPTATVDLNYFGGFIPHPQFHWQKLSPMLLLRSIVEVFIFFPGGLQSQSRQAHSILVAISAETELYSTVLHNFFTKALRIFYCMQALFPFTPLAMPSACEAMPMRPPARYFFITEFKTKAIFIMQFL